MAAAPLRRCCAAAPLRCYISAASLGLDAVRAAVGSLQCGRTNIKRVKGAKEGAAGRSAVMVGLCTDSHTGAPSLLLTLRAENMRTHRSEVAFPGGREDEADAANPATTALRELEEECGIPASSVEILGLSHDLFVPGKLRVTPVVGWLGEVDVTRLTLSPDEVQQAFLAPLSTLCDPDLKKSRNVEGKQWRKLKLKMLVYTGCEHKVWGLTAYIIHQLLEEIQPSLMLMLMQK